MAVDGTNTNVINIEDIEKARYVKLYAELLTLNEVKGASKDVERMHNIILELEKIVEKYKINASDEKELQKDGAKAKAQAEADKAQAEADKAKAEADETKKDKEREYRTECRKILENSIKLKNEYIKKEKEKIKAQIKDSEVKMRKIENSLIFSDDEIAAIKSDEEKKFKSDRAKRASDYAERNSNTKKNIKERTHSHKIIGVKHFARAFVSDAIVAGASIALLMFITGVTATPPVLAGVGVISFLAARGNRNLLEEIQFRNDKLKNKQIEEKNEKIGKYNNKIESTLSRKKKKKIIKKVNYNFNKYGFLAVALQIITMLILASVTGSLALQTIVGLIALIGTKVIRRKRNHKSI